MSRAYSFKRKPLTPQNKRRAEQAAKAAEERAKKEAEEQKAKSPIGKKGDWHSLKLPPGEDLPAVPAEPKITPAEALERLRRGETVTDPLGRDIQFGLEADKHLGKKGRDAEELKIRLQSLDRAEATVRNPLEIWYDARHKRDKYIRIIIDKDGREVLNVVVNEGGETYSWHSNAVSLDHYRNGVLVYLRAKTTGATDDP